MHFTKLVPNVFYNDINEGLKLFVDCLEFKMTHDERKSAKPFCVLEKNGLRLNLFEDAELVAEHHPEFRLVTSDIKEVDNKVAASHPGFLHPNLKTITLRPWGAKEFAVIDKQLGVICSGVVAERRRHCVRNAARLTKMSSLPYPTLAGWKC